MTMKKSLIVMSNNTTLCEKCPNTEFFLVPIFRIWTEFKEIRTRKNSVFGFFLRSTRDFD